MTRRSASPHQSEVPEICNRAAPEPSRRPRPCSRLYPWFVGASFAAGLSISYVVWGTAARADSQQAQTLVAPAAASTASLKMDLAGLEKQVNPPAGYQLPARYGNLGPRLLESGAINYDAFADVYQQAGDPLTAAQVAILKQGADQPIVISAESAHFLLNFFWAVGLVNKNPILTAGPITKYGRGKIDGFASTGGWTLGSRPVTQLFASADLIPLTPDQQARLEQAASAIYRPCCDNPTIFPDCNHGMAMLGLLELMASQDISVDQMFTAAKYVNAFWFPQQALMTAVYLKADRNIDFAQAEARLATGREFFSASGANQVSISLQSSGLLPKTPGNGGSCGS
jgi:hypothetical protein